MKKAYLKTIEALAAAIFTVFFMLVVIPQYTGTDSPKYGVAALEQLSKLDSWKSFVLTHSGCFNSSSAELSAYLDPILLDSYSYELCIGTARVFSDDKDMYTETRLIAGNLSDYNPKVVRLYTWAKGR